MRKNKRNANSVFNIFNIIFMLCVIFVTAYPFYYVVIASFSDPTELSRFDSLLLLPLEPFTTVAYEKVFSMPLIVTGFKNTLFVLVVGVSINIFMTVLGAYFLTIKGPMLKDIVAFMIIFTMYFSGGLVPSYLNVKDLGMLDSLWALIIPGAINTTNLIIMKSAFQSVPDSLIEAARLDGATYFQSLFKIMIPLNKATIAVLVLYSGVAHWNSWFNASIYLSNSELFPIQLVMRNLMTVSDVTMGADDMLEYADLIKYALIVVTSTPILCLYPFLQKYFTKGVMVGAVKG